jgi:tight adherence protein C
VSRSLAAALAAVAASCLVVAAQTFGASRRAEWIVRGREPRSGGRSGRRPLARVGASSLGRRVRRDRLVALAAAADTAWSVEELVGAKLLGPSAGLVLMLVGAPPIPLLAGPLALVAWWVPEMVLGRRARRRIAAASREIPLFLDLLAVATSAGLGPQMAVRIAAGPIAGPLADELAFAIRRADLGRRWRLELAAVGERLALLDLRRAAAILGRSETLGSSLAGEVARLASDVREGRRALAAERARTAPVKMLFPLVFLILPAFLLLTVVPVLLSTVRSIG